MIPAGLLHWFSGLTVGLAFGVWFAVFAMRTQARRFRRALDDIKRQHEGIEVEHARLRSELALVADRVIGAEPPAKPERLQ
jgi:hypothetical protein